ncbi:DNA-binding response regulator [Chitinophaga alhagiae]|uniref:DNA-binding response regulator n=1 Tax=Chitinophaga alhagiae TaxID=2203219 RepID=A0ABN5LNF8_9BACT|nr:response regulator transcription factor [Chitinophaga alhagiae]AWO00639.1 DNA-binding response regulator [Chitinophaga alhagiae]
MTNFLIADDHNIIRFGLKQIISTSFIPSTVKEAASFDEVVGLLEQRPFDLLILDINLPGGTHLAMLDAVRLRQPAIKILIFSASDEKVYAVKYLQAGADGYLEKSTSNVEIKNAISTILRNEKYMSPATRQQWLYRNSGQPRENPLSSLSARETDVLNFLLQGHPVAKIADMLSLHVSTVSTYKTRIYSKLEVQNLVELLQKVELYKNN